MLQFILECISFQLLFLVIYDLFLKRETFFQWNRFYLIGTYIISMVLPWIKIEAMKKTVPESFQAYPEFLWNTNDVVVTATPQEDASFSLSWEYTLLFGGMLLASLLFCYKLYQIYNLRKKGTVTTFKDFTQIIIANSAMAFSFFKSIFLGDKVIAQEHQSIIDHELVHIRQKHSYDLLFFELMRIVGWFNPLVYVYQRRVSELHEFIADAQVAKTDKKEQYEFLLSQVFQTQKISFINQFFKSSLIKKRIVMLTKEKSKQIFKLKYLLLLPLVFGMLAYTSIEFQNESVNELEYFTFESDDKLISEIEKEIELEFQEKGTWQLTLFSFYHIISLLGDDDQILSKRDYFKRDLLFAKMAEYEKGVKKDQVKKYMPSSKKYKAYVKRESGLRILDENLKRRIVLNQRSKITPIDKKTTYKDDQFVLEVGNIEKLTTEELTVFDQKVSQIIIKASDDHNSIILADLNYAFNIDSNKDELDFMASLNKLDSDEKNSKSNSTKNNEETDHVPFAVVDNVPNYQILPEIGITNEEVKKRIHQYNLMVVKRNRLLQSFNKSNPIIVDLNYLLNQQLETIRTKIKQSDTSQNEMERELLKLITEREKFKINKPQFQTDPVPFATVDEVPVFPGCEDAENKRSCFNEMMQKHISKNFNYPKEAQEKGIQGQVSVMFTITKNGSITNIRKRGAHKLLENEVERIIKRLPAMKAGIHKGKNVDVPFSIPVVFKLGIEKEDKYERLLEDRKQLKVEERSLIKDYNQLVQERKRLLQSSNANNPIIKNIDERLNAIKSELKENLKIEVETFEQQINNSSNPALELNQLIAERDRLLKSASIKNPIIVSLNERIEELKKGLGQESDVFPFATVEEVPVFPGCENAENKRTCFNKMMQKHIAKNFRYPQEAQEKGIQGRVAVMFTISEAGSIENIRLRGPDSLLENEVERIIKHLPKMKPGIHKGKAVKVPFSIPVNFKLQDEKKNKNLNPIEMSSTNDKSPLYIIDGKESSKVNMTDLNPGDIESMNVLKGDAATRKYGKKGKNGVIEIITKNKE